MSNNCFIVTARPTDQTKFDMMVNCLETLRQVTDDMIILSLNYIPSNLDQISNLYDSLVYSNVNESYDNEECTLSYSVNTDVFSLYTEYSNREYGRAANNLRYRAAKVAQTFGKTEFTCLDYDCFLYDKNFIDYLSKKPVMFLQGKQSATGNKLIEGYFFKLNDSTLHLLEYFSDKERYYNFMVDNSENKDNVLFYESGMFNYLIQHNLSDTFVSKFELEDFNINLDTNFSEFRAFEHENEIWLCIEYLSSSHSMLVQLEYENESHDLGDLKGRWHIIKLGPYYEGMFYNAIINGIKTKITITPESFKHTTVKFN